MNQKGPAFATTSRALTLPALAKFLASERTNVVAADAVTEKQKESEHRISPIERQTLRNNIVNGLLTAYQSVLMRR
ncbi:hypothetical protein [Sphingomonas xinjiangensis]|uniref:Uncharacterized protein n=1 Tax=Sphingomonas xinjiangensis TaxID=643568 RepID=A0A840YLU0_9SPHN|nr:hypothetical protein [Sphingomonas xinjiangensis]MBB5710526.1 hypothetical protein [Sphingomonas xinjiangensis]